MPQDKLQQTLMNRPVTVKGDVQYPHPGDKGVVDDKFMRGLMVALGLEGQQPGDAAGAIGGIAGILPFGKLLKGASQLRELPIRNIKPTSSKLGVFSKIPKWMEEELGPELAKAEHDISKRIPYDNIIEGNSNASYDQRILGSSPTEHNSDFTKELNTLHATDKARMRALEQAAGKKQMPQDWSNLRTKYAVQNPLPDMGTPLITHDPEVDPRDAERAGQYLRKVANAYPEEKGPDVYQNLHNLHVRKNGGGVYDDLTETIEAGVPGSGGGPSNSMEDTIGHEFRHALDKVNNPDVFKNYPNTMFSFFDIPKGYFNHPSEVRARATGGMERFIHDSEKAGQGHLQRQVLGPFSEGIEGLYGNWREDLGQLEKRVSKESRYKFVPYASEPSQDDLHLNGDALEPKARLKMRELDPRISGLPPVDGPLAKPNEANEDKLYRIMRERFQRRLEGLSDPRIPNLNTKKE